MSADGGLHDSAGGAHVAGIGAGRVSIVNLGPSFDDILFGDAGDDVLEGGLGDDVLTGGDGLDTASYVSAASAVTVALAIQGRAQNTGGGGIDTLVSIENVDGSAFADTVRGNAFANQLSGFDGDDILNGYSGDDMLIGGAGNDTLIGSLGADTINGGDGDDTLNGGAGDDSIAGGQGNDVYHVDSAGDDVVELAGQGTDEVRTTVDGYVLGANIENLRLRGAAMVGTGNDLANVIHAGAGPATLSGLGGNDGVFGSASSDSIDGGDGDDYLYGRNGNDTVHGGLGNDTIRGEIGSDTLFGDDGDDLIVGNAGIDILYGGDGNDDLRGGSQNDTLYAGNGNDYLRGEDGNDNLYGGAGRDIFTGGAGSDGFRFKDGDFAGLTNATADRITDFVQGADRIRLADVDANTLLAGDQAFRFIGTGGFTSAGATSAGELRYQISGNNTLIFGDTDGDGVADFAIALTGVIALLSSDFTL